MENDNDKSRIREAREQRRREQEKRRREIRDQECYDELWTKDGRQVLTMLHHYFDSAPLDMEFTTLRIWTETREASGLEIDFQFVAVALDYLWMVGEVCGECKPVGGFGTFQSWHWKRVGVGA